MSFLPRHAALATAPCEARETRSLLPENGFFFSRAREINPKREWRVKLLIPSGGGKGMDNMRNESESSQASLRWISGRDERLPLWIKNQGVQMSPSGRHDTQLLSDVVSDGKLLRGKRRALRYPVC